MAEDVLVDVDTLREQVREKYRAVAVEPDAEYHFHTGRHWRASSGTTPRSSTRSPIAPLSRLPASAIRFRCARSARANASSTSVRARASIRSSPRRSSAPRAASSVST